MTEQMIQREIVGRDWWLVFERDGDIPTHTRRMRAPRWVRWWTCPEFRHVWAFRASSVGAGIVTVQSLGMMLCVDWAPVDVDEAVEAARARGHLVVLVAGYAEQCYFPPVLAHCVTTTKRLLGIRAPLVHTPRQLWAYIHDRGLVL